MKYPASIQKLIEYFSKLPTVGPKTAERYVFYLLQQNDEELQKFAQSVAELKKKITICRYCGAVTEKNPCDICSDGGRDNKIICVVANTREMIAVEETDTFKGVYHILGGLINTVEEIKPEDLRIKSLVEKIKNQKTSEVIIALNPTMEGEATSLYISKILSHLNIKITRIAKGLPMGSDIEYADQHTLANALKYRIDI